MGMMSVVVVLDVDQDRVAMRLRHDYRRRHPVRGPDEQRRPAGCVWGTEQAVCAEDVNRRAGQCRFDGVEHGGDALALGDEHPRQFGRHRDGVPIACLYAHLGRKGSHDLRQGRRIAAHFERTADDRHHGAAHDESHLCVDTADVPAHYPL